METAKSTLSKNTRSLSSTRILQGENNEMICLKIYHGDWGDWDEKPANSIPHTSSESDNAISGAQF